MSAGSKSLRWFLVAVVSILLLYIVVLLITRGIILGLEGTDILGAESISPGICYAAFLVVGFALTLPAYRSAFFGVTLTTSQRIALRFQALALAAAMVSALMFVITQNLAFLAMIGGLIGVSGAST